MGDKGLSSHDPRRTTDSSIQSRTYVHVHTSLFRSPVRLTPATASTFGYETWYFVFIITDYNQLGVNPSTQLPTNGALVLSSHSSPARTRGAKIESNLLARQPLEQHGQEQQQALSQQHNTGKKDSIEKVLCCILLYYIVEQTRAEQ